MTPIIEKLFGNSRCQDCTDGTTIKEFFNICHSYFIFFILFKNNKIVYFIVLKFEEESVKKC